MTSAFPRKRAVWNRAILGSIVNAVKTAESETFACYEGWGRNNCFLNGVDGREGVMTFAGGHWYPDTPLVAVFHNVHSRRFSSASELDLEQFLLGCPPYQRSLAEQAGLPTLQLEYDGRILHRVTAAFWDDGELVAAATSWNEVIEGGASLISEELTDDLGLAVERFAQNYGMTAEQTAFSRSLFERKIAHPPAQIELTADEVAFLESTFKDPRMEYAELHRLSSRSETEVPTRESESGAPKMWWEGIDPKAEFEKAMSACREKLAELGIMFP